jgi:hypothetical protein
VAVHNASLDLVSSRVQNYQSSPDPHGVLLDQLWLR